MHFAGISNLHELEEYSLQSLQTVWKNVSINYQRLLTVIFAQQTRLLTSITIFGRLAHQWRWEQRRISLKIERFNPLTPTAAIMGTSIKHPVPDRVKPSFVICNFWHPGTLTLSPERQSARMSKITNDGLTLSGARFFIAVPISQQWASKG